MICNVIYWAKSWYEYPNEHRLHRVVQQSEVRLALAEWCVSRARGKLQLSGFCCVHCTWWVLEDNIHTAPKVGCKWESIGAHSFFCPKVQCISEQPSASPGCPVLNMHTAHCNTAFMTTWRSNTQCNSEVLFKNRLSEWQKRGFLV